MDQPHTERLQHHLDRLAMHQAAVDAHHQELVDEMARRQAEADRVARIEAAAQEPTDARK